MKVIVLTVLFFTILQIARACDIGAEAALQIIEAVTKYTSTTGAKNENCVAVMNKKSIVEIRLIRQSAMICEALKTKGADCDKACKNLRKDRHQILAIQQEKFKKEELEADDALMKFCKQDQNACEDIIKAPEEIQDKFLENIAPNFAELKRIIKSTSTSNYEFMLEAAKILDGDLGAQVVKCMSEIDENLPKFATSFNDKQNKT